MKGALLCFSLAFSLLLGELILRSLGYAAIYEIYSTPEMLWQQDELLGWSHEPNSVEDYIGPRPWPVEFRSRVAINSIGLRGPELAPIPEDGIRILFLGDSMVAGFEVEYEETFVARLEKKLSEKFSVPVQVINGGVRGYGADQSYLYFRERGRDLKPDLVLHWMSENDLIEDITIHRMRRIFGKAAFVDDGSSRLKLIAVPVPLYPVCSEYRVDPDRGIVRYDGFAGRMLCRVQMVLFDRSALFSVVTTLLPWDQWGTLLRSLYYVGMPSPNLSRGEGGRAESEARPPVTGKILQEMAETIRATGAYFTFVATPAGIERFRGSGIEFDDSEVLLVDRVDAFDQTSIRFEHDSHFNAAGHEIVAGQIAEELTPILEVLIADQAAEADRTTPD